MTLASKVQGVRIASLKSLVFIPNGYDNSWQGGASTHLLLAEPNISTYGTSDYIGVKRAFSTEMGIYVFQTFGGRIMVKNFLPETGKQL